MYNEILILILLMILITFFVNRKKENFKIQYLSPIIHKEEKKYKGQNNKQLPWCESWKHCRKHKFKCFINKHLQRKCMWIC